MKTGQTILSYYPKSMQRTSHHAFKYFIREIMKKLKKGYDYAKLSPQPIGPGLFTIELTVTTRIVEETENLAGPDHLAKKIADHNIKSITINRDAIEAHVSELIEQILMPEHNKSIDKFDRPNIQIIFGQQKKQTIKAEETHPYERSIQRLYQDCKKFEQLSTHEQESLIEWLEKVLSDKDNKIWNKFHNPSQASYFRGELRRIRQLRSES
jgi:polyhydroxyalkanoate synthesis regulator phasin